MDTTKTSSLKGLPLASLAHPFTLVSPKYNARPCDSFDYLEKLLRPEKILRAHCFRIDSEKTMREAFKLDEHMPRIPSKALLDYTLDEKAKIWHSMFIMSELSPVFDLYDRHDEHNGRYCLPPIPEAKVFAKVKSSMWRWGCYGEDWNAIVMAYDALTTFSFGEGFEVTLDHSTGYNEFGFSKYSRTFLDGCLAYLVHYKGEHVLTIGFSLARDRRLLINQIQLKNKKGNRWLFKLPKPYMEYVIDLMYRTFCQNFKVYIVNGPDMGEHIVHCYKNNDSENQPDPHDILRVQKSYAVRLDGYARVGRPWTCNRQRFHRLHPRVRGTNPGKSSVVTTPFRPLAIAV